MKLSETFLNRYSNSFPEAFGLLLLCVAFPKKFQSVVEANEQCPHPTAFYYNFGKYRETFIYNFCYIIIGTVVSYKVRKTKILNSN